MASKRGSSTKRELYAHLRVWPPLFCAKCSGGLTLVFRWAGDGWETKGFSVCFLGLVSGGFGVNLSGQEFGVGSGGLGAKACGRNLETSKSVVFARERFSCLFVVCN